LIALRLITFNNLDSLQPESLIAQAVSDRRITTPMHSDRQELIGYDAGVICGG